MFNILVSFIVFIATISNFISHLDKMRNQYNLMANNHHSHDLSSAWSERKDKMVIVYWCLYLISCLSSGLIVPFLIKHYGF